MQEVLLKESIQFGLRYKCMSWPIILADDCLQMWICFIAKTTGVMYSCVYIMVRGL